MILQCLWPGNRSAGLLLAPRACPKIGACWFSNVPAAYPQQKLNQGSLSTWRWILYRHRFLRPVITRNMFFSSFLWVWKQPVLKVSKCHFLLLRSSHVEFILYPFPFMFLSLRVLFLSCSFHVLLLGIHVLSCSVAIYQAYKSHFVIHFFVFLLPSFWRLVPVAIFSSWTGTCIRMYKVVIVLLHFISFLPFSGPVMRWKGQAKLKWKARFFYTVAFSFARPLSLKKAFHPRLRSKIES